MPTPAISLKRINKRFGPVWANRDIDLTVMPGTIHGIVGENGAGKSTLMSILYGFYTADSGEIAINGKPLSIQSSQQAIDAGIGMVHQHFMLVETFSVLENVLLGAEEQSLLSKVLNHGRKALQRIGKAHGMEVDPDAIVGELPVGMQQRVEILKALYRGARILILDEPTGVLTPQEADRLFEILDQLRSNGVTILLITHKLREIMHICDQVSVMRQGEMVAHRRIVETSTDELANLMVGRKVGLTENKPSAQIGEARLTASGVHYTDSRGIERLHNIHLELRSGEILGVAGVAGNGQSELLNILSGAITPHEGELHLLTSKGEQTLLANESRDARLFRQLGVGHVPEDRLKQGLVPNFSASYNAILGYENDAKYGQHLLSTDNVVADTKTMMASFDVRPAIPELKTANFSGGNQQKLIIAREMMRQPDILIVGQPTRGVDIGAIEFIHQQLIKARDEGAAVLLVSVELEEILALSDRIIVMVDGRISGEVMPSQTNEQELGLLMSNAASTIRETLEVTLPEEVSP
ncbi:ABC transporter ATP-binding protein [Endozoicomonas ascidiicola]|uniref:ABC transporter ATP-binding protein n=1 Tax=Endozoicomonas ascidiicola TaxID=1698521 RepID=UPI0008321917|nr:ABC transporter ATP-binding protein [Endozoicomonas ascidiicola]